MGPERRMRSVNYKTTPSPGAHKISAQTFSLTSPKRRWQLRGFAGVTNYSPPQFAIQNCHQIILGAGNKHGGRAVYRGITSRPGGRKRRIPQCRRASPQNLHAVFATLSQPYLELYFSPRLERLRSAAVSVGRPMAIGRNSGSPQRAGDTIRMNIL